MKKIFKPTLLILTGLCLLSFTLNSCKKHHTTPAATTVTDADGNVYQTVTIGTQIWTTENLKSTKFNDGTDIPYKPNAADWTAQETPAFCWYNNDEAANKNKYGALYNREVANSPLIAPAGWHVPKIADWNILQNYLGANAGGMLKQTGTANWTIPNTGATNETGFNALAGGLREDTGTFNYLQTRAAFWVKSDDVGNLAFSQSAIILYNQSQLYTVNSFNGAFNGLSIRLVKD